MNLKNCVICDSSLTEETNSGEHLIPRSIGGWKKVKNFICETCNNNAGATWDAELAKYLNPLSLLCKIKREGSEVPAQKFSFITGEEIVLKPDGSMTIPKPIFSKKETSDGKLEINIQARSPNEAKKMLAGLKKKHPKFNIEEAEKHLSYTSNKPTSPLHIQLEFGGEKAGRSVVKTALAWAVENGLEASTCLEAVSYLRDKNAPACFGYYYEKDLIKNRPQDRVFHCVGISNKNTQGQLLAYVEYFSAQRIIVRLTDDYRGKEIHQIYAIDPIKGEETLLEFDLNLTKEDVQDTYDYKKTRKELQEAAFGIPLTVAIKNDFDTELNKQITEATEYAFKNCGVPEGAILTEQDISLITNLMLEKLLPFLKLHMPNRNSS